MVRFLYTEQNVYICLLKMMLLVLQTDKEESRIQANRVYLRSGRNIDSVLKVKVKRLSSELVGKRF